MTNTIWPFEPEKGERLYVIGDVHGELRPLRRILDRIERDLAERPTQKTKIICLGDYIDRGEDSRGVIDLIRELAEAEILIPLCGNHEAMLIDILNTGAGLSEWRQYGGLETLSSFGVTVDDFMRGRNRDKTRQDLIEKFGPERAEFLNQLRYSYTSGTYYFCHAGISPDVALAMQDPKDLLWIRDPFLNYAAPFEKCIVHGHTPVEQVDIRSNRINVDTGAYLTGRLSCVILEGRNIAVLNSRDLRISNIF